VADITELAAELVDVQHQLAFQEDTITALNDALALQQKEILILRRQVELLKQRQDEQRESSSDQGPVSPSDEKPPHY